jgi:hypothetical protein
MLTPLVEVCVCAGKVLVELPAAESGINCEIPSTTFDIQRDWPLETMGLDDITKFSGPLSRRKREIAKKTLTYILIGPCVPFVAVYVLVVATKDKIRERGKTRQRPKEL